MPPKEIGFGKAEVIILLVGPDGNAGAQELSPPEQISFGIAEIQEQALLG